MTEKEDLPAIFAIMVIAGLGGFLCLLVGILAGIGWLIWRLF